MVVLSDAINKNEDRPKQEKCPFHFKRWNAHWFTFFGIRVIIGEFK